MDGLQKTSRIFVGDVRSVDVGCSGESCAIRAADRDDWISLVDSLPQ